MKQSGTDCDRLLEIALCRADGREISPDASRFATEHLRGCEACKVDRGVSELLLYDGEDPHTESLDDISRRRLVDEVLTAAASEEDDTAIHRDRRPTSLKNARRGKHAALGALAAAAMVAAGLFVFSLKGPDPPAIEPTPRLAKVKDVLKGMVLLASGELSLAEKKLAAGDALTTGQHLTVVQGKAVLALPEGVALMAHAATSIRLEKMDRDEVAVHLISGELMASVPPDTSARRFTVATSRGRVVVVGTVFEVSVDREQVAVKVLKGSVRLEEASRPARAVRASHGAILGEGEVYPLDLSEQEAAWQDARILDLLAQTDGTALEIDSAPPGALVALDGTAMGTTPLAAVVRPGPRTLDLTLDGHAPIRERLHLVRDGNVTRAFELKPLHTSADSEADDGRPARELPSARKSAKRETAEEMLKKAQNLRAARDWTGATKVYEKLAIRYRGTSFSRNALVALGEMQLDHLGKPHLALRSFESYLTEAPGGALVPEAAYGRIRALRALGRTSDEIDALQQFLSRFPNGVRAPAARQRLGQLESRTP